MEYKITVEYTFNPKKVARAIYDDVLNEIPSVEVMYDYLDYSYCEEIFEEDWRIDFSDLDENNKKLIASLIWNEYEELLYENE